MADPESSPPTHDRRSILKLLGGSTAGLAGFTSTTAAADWGADRGLLGFEPATIERPTQDAHCWFVNAADRAVDIYVNYADKPLITDVAPEEDGPMFSIDSDADGIYGTYTFEMRPAGRPDGPVLAQTSVLLRQVESYTGVFHELADSYQLSIYRNDFRPSADARFEIRHNAKPEQIDWKLFPKPEADPRIPDDERSGTLERGQWQEAYDVIENDYRLEIYHDGDLVAYRQDLSLEHEREIVCYVVGDPKWWMGSDRKEAHIRRDEFQVQKRETHRDDITTPPAEPYTTTDDNQSPTIEVDDLSYYETNAAETDISATDPDGIVADLAVDTVDPYTDAFNIPDESLYQGFDIGDPTTGTLTVRPKAPAANYDVRILANPEGLGETVATNVSVEVKPVDIPRLHNLVDTYHAQDEIEDQYARDLHEYLDQAKTHLDASETSAACTDLKHVIDLVSEYKDAGVSETACVDITKETRALRSRLGCG